VRAETEFDAVQRDDVDLLIGTPEEFQGNERDVMILTFGIGANQRYARGFYEKPTRFNVATSRARKYTYAVLGACPPSALLLRRYFGAFGYTPTLSEPSEDVIEPSPLERMGSRLTWTFDPRLCESEFERLLLNCLQEFIDGQTKHRLKLFNQVRTCGQKRLDFVLYDEDSTRSVAIEVDGPDHFVEDGRTYSSAHLERVSVLKRAGWNIVHVPYFQWYRNGWLYDRNDPQFAQISEKFYDEISGHLDISRHRRTRSISLNRD
jgi:very-short-patch-repair endonuclease